MSDHYTFADHPHPQDWQGGKTEREQAYEDIELTMPPLYGASLERRQKCRDVIADVIGAECLMPVENVQRIANLIVVRLQEPLDP